MIRFVFLAILACGCARPAKPAEEKVPPAPVKWEAARQIVLEEWTELVGTSQPLPDHAARVTAPVEGRVVSVLQGAAGKTIAEGQPVKAGDVLARLDATVLIATREKADGARKVLLAEKETAELAVRLAELEVKRLAELKRQLGSSAAGGVPLVSTIEVEKANVALEAARAAVKTDDRKLEAADQELAALDRQIQLYTLAAPRAGRLGRMQVVVGQTLSAGTAVADVVDVEEEIDVLCFVPPSEARKLHAEQPAKVDATSPAEGRVVFIADQAEADSGLVAIKVRFPNRELMLRANTVVRLRVLSQPGRACWAVRESALIEDNDPPGIVIAEDVETKKNADGKEEQIGKARRLQAVTGVRDRVMHYVEIVRLEEGPGKPWRGDLQGSLFVFEKGQGVQTGDAVKLEEEDEG